MRFDAPTNCTRYQFLHFPKPQRGLNLESDVKGQDVQNDVDQFDQSRELGEEDDAKKDDLLKDAIAEATGKDVSKLEGMDVQKYRKEAAVDKLSSTFSACKDAGIDDCLDDAKFELKKSLGRSTDVTTTA